MRAAPLREPPLLEPRDDPPEGRPPPLGRPSEGRGEDGRPVDDELERRSGDDIGIPAYGREQPKTTKRPTRGRRSWPATGQKCLEAPEGASSVEIRRRPTLPGGLPPSTIGAGSLNFRVRDGNGCDPAAIATEIYCQGGAPPKKVGRSPPSTPEQARAMFKPSPRPISTGRLHTLPCLHLRPINVMVSSRALLR